MKFLLHSHFPAGHTYPMQAIAQRLVGDGHEVAWLTSADNEARVAAAGACFIATKEIAAVDEPFKRQGSTGLLGDESLRQEGRLLAQVADYRRITQHYKPDVLLVDVFPQGARAMQELGEIPVYATLGVIPLYLSSKEAPKALSGNAPPESRRGLLKNYLRHKYEQLLVLPFKLKPIIDRERAVLGLPKLPYGQPLENFNYSPHLHIQASSPSLEFCLKPKGRMSKANARFVGPLVAPANSYMPQLPLWWDEVDDHPRVVAVTQGTLAMDPNDLVIPAIEALGDEPSIMLIVISPYAEELAREHRFNNLRFAKWLPYSQLLPRLSLLITNGGYGSITQALAHGVPLLCAGQTEDKKDTAARVAWCQAGIDLKTDNPSPSELWIAAKRILDDESYAARATQISDELVCLGGAITAADLLCHLATQHQQQK
ncbi:hypothetical protein B0I35DRAFT_186719 [Stachybotrys elegans]|uniref:Erythromycin biosynthesis protein CIII-like C-terminal domain-containing protein n=1 Tax=Stachybotrys elegans TaxID=80388 RepID=A0A8K0SVJ3_9HYPO|nr:hypothetical protein B0I35DRAFT_186719 [Stachybotrys elegans]